MIRYTRSARTLHGKGGEAIKWAKNLAEYLNAQEYNIKISVFTSRFGDLNCVHWVADANDLGALDQWQKEVAKDPGYRELRRSAVDLFVQDSVKDVVMSSIS